MPSLKGLTCQIQWAETNLPFQEYGTFYGDGVVETFIAVPNKPQAFTIHVTSKKFIYEGLSLVVFIDGNYQCNRNRVNLLPPKKGLPRERTEVDFLLRQKEKAIGEGNYMGREWRFDDHNVVPELPQGLQESHFELLGTIEVLALRCRARNPNESATSSPSSAAASDVLHTHKVPGEDGATSDKEQEDASHESCRKQNASNKSVSSFDGPNDYPPGIGYDGYGRPPGTWQWRWQPEQESEYQNGHFEPGTASQSKGVPDYPEHDSRRFSDFRQPPQEFERRRAEKRVHFDYGPPEEPLRVGPGRYSDRCEDARRTTRTSIWSDEGRSRSTPALSDWEPRSQTRFDHRPQHDGCQPRQSQHYLYDPVNGRYSDCPPAPCEHARPTPPFPPLPPQAPSLRPCLPTVIHPPTAPAGWYQNPMPQKYMPPQVQPAPHIIPGVIPGFPPAFFAPGPGYLPSQPIPPTFGYGVANGLATVHPFQAPNNNEPGGLDPSKDENNPADNDPAADPWVANIAPDIKQNPSADEWGFPRDASNNANEADKWKGDSVVQNAGDSWNVSSTSGNQNQTNNDQGQYAWETNATAVQDSSNNNGCWNDSSSNAQATDGNKRPLYGPHGAYYALKRSTEVDLPADAEEEPRYDVPQCVVDSRGSSKQVQPGKGYLYTKKRCCPEYVDDMHEPYARFVFKYRTQDQLKNELGIELETEPTGDEEVQHLQNMDKNELIQMFLRAKGALGGNIPEAPPKIASPTGRTSSIPVPVDPPQQEFLRYTLPPLRNASNGQLSGQGMSTNNATGVEDDWGNPNPGRGGGGGGSGGVGGVNNEPSPRWDAGGVNPEAAGGNWNQQSQQGAPGNWDGSGEKAGQQGIASNAWEHQTSQATPQPIPYAPTTTGLPPFGTLPDISQPYGGFGQELGFNNSPAPIPYSAHGGNPNMVSTGGRPGGTGGVPATAAAAPPSNAGITGGAASPAGGW